MTAITVGEVIRLVLAQHPLEAGTEGLVVCTGCRRTLAYPNAHLLSAIMEVLEPGLTPPEPETPGQKQDPRESQIVWEAK
jgi:hypothetical protein